MTFSPSKKMAVLLASAALMIGSTAPAFSQSSGGAAAGGTADATAQASAPAKTTNAFVHMLGGEEEGDDDPVNARVRVVNAAKGTLLQATGFNRPGFPGMGGVRCEGGVFCACALACSGDAPAAGACPFFAAAVGGPIT